MSTIVISRNTLVVMIGAAGCGKSTFAAKHFLPTQIVSSDECRALVFDDPTNQSVSGHAFDLMHFIIERRLLLGRTTVADATNLKRENRKTLQKIARWYGFNTAAIVFNMRLETCIERNANRARVVPEDALRLQYELLERTLETINHEGFDYVFILDETAQANVSITIGRAINRRPAPTAPSQQ
ncbi:MAG TPA: AAA family ATPase [Blastocatellia bacterium]|nr:AAA family ATPase [Blastocatellia bacterium]